jgi:hypothetical protein
LPLIKTLSPLTSLQLYISKARVKIQGYKGIKRDIITKNVFSIILESSDEALKHKKIEAQQFLKRQ